MPHRLLVGKNCPAPLMTNGRPGYKWSWFISRVDYYYRCLQAEDNTAAYAARPFAASGIKKAGKCFRKEQESLLSLKICIG